PTLAMLATGNRLQQNWSATETPVDFFDVKGDVEALLARTGSLDEFRFVADKHSALHPGQTARIDKLIDGEWTELGWMGALHPETQTQVDIKQSLFVVQLDMSLLLQTTIPAFEE
ncbi:hypothetical protein Q4595_22375, partial [Wenyingzhuangia sp. 1_MG-2023]|nr:hypothetical protein [Wenyingzhuangia sp. 1_MG-2023]